MDQICPKRVFPVLKKEKEKKREKKLPKKGISGLKQKKLHFFVRPWTLLTILKFSAQGPTDTTAF